MEPQVTRILLCDDHALYRECLRGFFERWDEFEVAGEASDGLEAVRLCDEKAPDLVLMDVEMPGMNGIEAAGIIHERHPGTVIVMLTVSMEDGDLAEAVNAGAQGYILKNVSARQLREHLHSALKGESVLSCAMGKVCTEIIKNGFVPNSSRTEPSKSSSLLDEQERQILRYMAQGESNKEIGAHLYLGENTVKKKISTILAKLGLENRVQAVVFAIHDGLID